MIYNFLTTKMSLLRPAKPYGMKNSQTSLVIIPIVRFPVNFLLQFWFGFEKLLKGRIFGRNLRGGRVAETEFNFKNLNSSRSNSIPFKNCLKTFVQIPSKQANAVISNSKPSLSE